MKHTSGPWHIGMRPGPIVYSPMGEQIADMQSTLLPKNENVANAKLIAAAPNLLNALKNLITQLNELDDTDLSETFEGFDLTEAQNAINSTE